MSIEATLERIAAALETIAARPVVSTTMVEETKPARTPRVNKTPLTPEPVVEPETVEEDPLADDIEEDPLAEAPPAEPTYTEDQVRKALANYREINGSDAMKAILTAHGATGLSSLKPDHYPSVMKAAL